MYEFLLVLIVVFWGWACSYFAQQRGRNPYGWFFLGFFFGPFPLVALLLMPDLKKSPPPPTEIPEVHVSHHSPFNNFDWYYLDENRETVGPVTFTTLQELWSEQKVNEQSYVWNDTMENWKKVSEVNELIPTLENKKDLSTSDIKKPQ